MAISSNEIARDIRGKILSGHWQPQQQLPARGALVDLYSSSRATLQKAIDTLCHEGILQTGSTNGTYVAKRPANLYSTALVLPVDKSRHPEYSYLREALEQQRLHLEERFARLFIIYRLHGDNENDAEFQRLLADARDQKVSGIIYTDTPSESAVNALRHLPLPRVALTRENVFAFSNVACDYEMFFRMSVEYLKKCKRSRIAVISNQELNPEYIVNCRKLAANYDMVIPPEWEIGLGLRFHPQHWASCVTRLLFCRRIKERPDGVIIANENLISYVLEALRQEDILPGRNFDIAAHASFPIHAPELLNVRRIGFDIYDIVGSCLEALSQKRPAHSFSPLKLVSATAEQSACSAIKTPAGKLRRKRQSAR